MIASQSPERDVVAVRILDAELAKAVRGVVVT
jgi:hypothetical protein